MHGLWLFLHNMGYIVWIGGGLATMLAGIAAKRFSPAERLAVYRVTSFIQRALVGTGAIVTLVTGFILAMPYMETMPSWMGAMMGLGTLGALIAVTLSVPTAAKLGRLELDPRGEIPEVFFRLRKRQAWAATVAGSLGLLALGAATFYRF
ncbi:MAG TPA: hypothetical protein VMH88_05490 [Gemmatimonadales bacterium]|nr:hypothetical protein [Gemmatimonadales bacterium]